MIEMSWLFCVCSLFQEKIVSKCLWVRPSSNFWRLKLCEVCPASVERLWKPLEKEFQDAGNVFILICVEQFG